MGVVLSPRRAGVDDLYGSWWEWRPVEALLRDAAVIDLEGIGPIPDELLWAELDAEQAGRIADFLDKFIEKLGPDQRVLIDGSLTDVPDTGELYRDEQWYKNYSTHKQWLEKFRDFCRVSDGFTVY